MEDSPEDLWAQRILAAGEPNYADSAAAMLPRRDYRSFVGTPDDGDETILAWSGAHILCRRGDPRGAILERFLAFRLDGEDFGADFERMSSGCTDGSETGTPGFLPERWFRYTKGGASASLRSFAGIGGDGRADHVQWIEITVVNEATQPLRGNLEIITGLRGWAGSRPRGRLHELPVEDRVERRNDRLLVDQFGKPILLSDAPFQLVGSEWEPTCRFAYELKPGERRTVTIQAVCDAAPEMDLLRPTRTIAEARRDFSSFWRRTLDSGMRITLPEKRLEGLCDAFLAQCMIMPDHGAPRYGSYYYDQCYGVEEGPGTVALAQWGYAREAQAGARFFLQQAVDDNRTIHKQYRKGVAPRYAWEVYLAGRDAEFLAQALPLMRQCADSLLAERHASQEKGDGSLPSRYGLLARHVYGGDIVEPAYSLFSNSCAWAGVRATGLACRALGQEEAARQYAEEAAAYRKDLLALFDKILDRSVDPPFLPLSLGRRNLSPNQGDPTPALLNQDKMAAYWGLFAGWVLECFLVPPRGDYAEAMMATYMRRGGLWDGLLRFANEYGDWDPHYTYGLQEYWFEREERGRFLVSFYGMLANELSRNAWIHGEVSNVFPMRTENFAQASRAYERIWRKGRLECREPIITAAGVLLRDVRDMLVSEGHEESRDLDGRLHLLRNSPGAWLRDGQPLVVERAQTAFGLLSYRVDCDLEKNRRLALQLELTSDQPVPVRIHAHPAGYGDIRAARWKNAKDVKTTGPWTEANVQDRAEVEIEF